MENRLLFIIAAPRSGSTLLARMLGAHSRISAPAELHLLTPLAHLGFYERVDAAPYDPIITQRGQREMVAALPNGETDYLAALRACTDEIYAKLLEPTGCELLLEKTPAYALALDFLAKLYPNARYLVLTRNPLAVWSSVVQSFFDGDQEEAERISPGLPRFVPAIARFLRERPVPIHPLRYEDLVREPEATARALCEFAGLAFEPGIVDYGSAPASSSGVAKGLGDPITVGKETRPTTRSIARWAEDMAGDPAKIDQARRILDHLTDPDLETWGYDRSELEAELAAIPPAGARQGGRGTSAYTLERKLLASVRRQVHRRKALGALVRKCREACDLLLR